jgi:hypothetical protein
MNENQARRDAKWDADKAEEKREREANRKADKEESKAERKADKEETMAKMERLLADNREIKADNAEMMATIRSCQEETIKALREAFLEEKGSAPEEPESVAEPKEVPERATERETGTLRPRACTLPSNICSMECTSHCSLLKAALPE